MELVKFKSISIIPEAPNTKQSVKVSGSLSLPIPLGVIVSITYPKQWWEVIGSPEVREATIAIGGSFDVNFAAFDREGDYELTVRVYPGPSYPISKFVLPPAPPIATSKVIKFTVSERGGEPGAQTGKNFRFYQPVVSPSKCYSGDKIKISCAVESLKESTTKIVVKCDIAEGSALLPTAGTSLVVLESSITTMLAGEKRTFVFDYITTSRKTDRRDITVSAYIDGSFQDSAHFDDAFLVSTEGAGLEFDFGQMEAEPSSVVPGDTVKIICPLTLVSGDTTKATAKIQVYDDGMLWLSGGLLKNIDVPEFTIKPGQSMKMIANYIATDTGKLNRDVGLEIWVAGEKIDSWQADSIFTVESGKPEVGVADASATPYSAKEGDSVNISSRITLKSNAAVKLSARFNIYEASPIPGRIGKFLEAIDVPEFTVSPDSSKPIGVVHQAKYTGSVGRDVGIELNYRGNKFWDGYYNDRFDVDLPAQPAPGMHRLNLLWVPMTGGYSVSVYPQKSQYAEGEEVTVYAEPSGEFDHWEGDLDGTGPSQFLSFTKDRDLTVKAYFKTAIQQVVSFTIRASNPPYVSTSEWTLYYREESGVDRGDGLWHGIEDSMVFNRVNYRGVLIAFCKGGWPYYEVSSEYPSEMKSFIDGAVYEFDIVGGQVVKVS